MSGHTDGLLGKQPGKRQRAPFRSQIHTDQSVQFLHRTASEFILNGSHAELDAMMSKIIDHSNPQTSLFK